MTRFKILLLSFSIILLVSIIGYFCYTFFWLFDKKAPYVGSFDHQLKIIKEKLKLKKGKTLVDLGCGDGKALRYFKKNFELKLLEGYDIKRHITLFGKIVNRFYGCSDIKLYGQDFARADLKKYDYIYVYLFPGQLAIIEDRLFSNMKDDAIIISNSFKFKKNNFYETLKNSKGKDIIYLYKK